MGKLPSDKTKPSVAFSVANWLRETQRTRNQGEDAVVPCGSCTACCTSSYFIHIAPDETDALAAIPKKWLVKAPGLPKGHVLLGYDEKGHCPMFRENRCSIYDRRPRTCRQYDCRLYAVTETAPEDDRHGIRGAISQWRVQAKTPREQDLLRAVRAAARFLRQHATAFPEGMVPTQPSGQALMALRGHKLFLPGKDVPVAERITEWVRLIKTKSKA